MTVSEFSGVVAFDVTTGASGVSTTPDSGNVMTNFADEIIVGAIGVEGVIGDTFTVGTDYLTNPPTRVATSGSTAATNILIDPEYRIVSEANFYLADATITSRDWSAAVATYKGVDRWWNPIAANKQLRSWQVYNTNNGNSITLDKIKVSWTGGGLARLNGFVLNGASKWPGGTATTGSTVDITDTVLANGGSWTGLNTYLQWDNNGPADPVTVTCQFIYSGDTSTSDAKSHEVVLWDGAQNGGGMPSERVFTVTATGQVNQTVGGYFKVLKTVKAVVSSTPGLAALEIIDWDEGDKNIP